MSTFKSMALFSGAALSALAAPAMAQTAPAPAAQADAPAMGEIVVTAQRRAESVTKVPISITVADGAQLERQQVNTVNDLARIAPSLEIQSAPGQNTGGGGAIRGIGTQTFSAGAVASVGVVVDQVSQGNANIANLFDVARVEVLKGPQGTLFGLTTSAGVINITTNKPEFDKLSLRLRTELSNAGTAGSKSGNQVMQGVINVPLASNAAIRVAGFGNLRQGPDYDVTSGKYVSNNTWGLRGHLLWEPTDKLTINLIGDYTKTRTTNGGDFFTFVKASGAAAFPLAAGVPDNVAGNLASCGVTAYEGNRNFCTSQSYVDRSYTGGASLQIDYRAEPFTITSITSYRKSLETGSGAASNVFRADPLLLQVFNGDLHRPIDLFTQELRVSSPADQLFEYTGGLFISSQIQSRAPETLLVGIHPAPGVLIPVSAGGGTGAFRVSDRSMAVFGQTTIHVSPKFRLIVGGRFTNDDLKLDTYAGALTGSTNSHTALEVGKFSWKGGAQYDLTRKTMVYGTVSRGFKGGQIATPAYPLTPYAVRPEIPTSYELGLKSTLMRGWVLDSSLFYSTIKDFQAQSCSTNTLGTISCLVQNVDGVKSRGAEINLFGKVTRDLSLNTGFIWAKATYPKGFLGTDGTNIGGTQLAYAPEYKFTMSGEYSHRLTDRLNGFFAADTVWKSRIRYEANSLSDTTFRPHWVVGGRIGVRTADDRYTLAIFARNLFNVHEPALMQSSFPYSGAANVGAIYGPQSFRSVGLSLDGKF
ncbi:MAG: TonB-dependent receptor [Sphingomonadales bacterium]|nr:TonB-dependent receptor [Sphingomonadales bacterium]MDE2167861.1 TonB-dependent receptor [Sphingomonadales bacterium]